MSAFYKTSDAAVMAAMAAFESQAADVRQAGEEFAAHYGGVLLTKRDMRRYAIAGLCFDPAKDDPLWTKPDPKLANMQRPRSSVKGATKDQKAALADLSAGWNARFPSAIANFEPVLAAMGTDWGHLFLSGLGLFKLDDCIYVTTSAKLAPCMQEILSSEHTAAKAKYQAAKEPA